MTKLIVLLGIMLGTQVAQAYEVECKLQIFHNWKTATKFEAYPDDVTELIGLSGTPDEKVEKKFDIKKVSYTNSANEKVAFYTIANADNLKKNDWKDLSVVKTGDSISIGLELLSDKTTNLVCKTNSIDKSAIIFTESQGANYSNSLIPHLVSQAVSRLAVICKKTNELAINNSDTPKEQNLPGASPSGVQVQKQ
jgi:hypothetical protein